MTLRPLVRKLRSNLAAWSRAAFLGCAVIGGSLWLLHATIYRVWPAVVDHPYFRLTSVHIRCDTDALGPKEIAVTAGLYAGSSLWRIDVAAAEAALEAPEWVETATVRRHFPNRVSVEVKERKPVAAAPAPGGPYFVDATGIVYRPLGAREYPDVPYLTGWQAAPDEMGRAQRLRELLDIARVAEERGLRLSQVEIDRGGDFWVYPDGRRMPVRLGKSADASKAFARVRATLAKVPEGSTAVREVDASYPDRIVLRTWEGGYTTLVAELSGKPRDERALAKAQKPKAPSGSDRG
jgi:hypothetical protein